MSKAAHDDPAPPPPPTGATWSAPRFLAYAPSCFPHRKAQATPRRPRGATQTDSHAGAPDLDASARGTRSGGDRSASASGGGGIGPSPKPAG